MSGGILETSDFDAFYDTGDFAIEVTIAGELESGLLNREEIDTENIQGVRWTFRTNSRQAEGETITVSQNSNNTITAEQAGNYTVEAVLPLEFGEYLHILSKDGT